MSYTETAILIMIEGHDTPFNSFEYQKTSEIPETDPQYKVLCEWKHCDYSHFHNNRFLFLAKKENIVPNAVEKSRTGAFRSQDQTLSFFFRLKKKQSL